MSLTQLAALIWSGRWRLLACTLACLAGAMAVSSQLPKSYEAKARVILELMGPDLVNGTVVGNKSTDSYIRTQQILATSERVGERAVEKLGWVNNPAVVEAWQQDTGGVGDIRSWAAARLLGAVAAYPLEGGGTLEINYRAPDPDAAQTVARALREAYIETSLALQTEAAARRAKRYEELVVPARKAFDAAQAALVAVQRETGTVLTPAGTDMQAGNIDQIARSVMAARLRGDRDAADAARRNSASQLGGLRNQLVQVEQAIAASDDTLGKSNPEYQALTEHRALLVGQIARANAAVQAQSAQVASAARRMAQTSDDAYQAEQARLLASQPVNLRVTQALRLVALRGGELQRLEANLANARLAAGRTESGLVVMGDVIGNNVPVSPNIPLNALLAALFGLALGLASVMIDGLWRREVLVADDLAAAAGVPVLAVLRAERRRRWWPRRRAAAA